MPLDITSFRAFAGGNPEALRESQRRRFKPVEIIDEVIANDEKWRALTGGWSSLSDTDVDLGVR